MFTFLKSYRPVLNVFKTYLGIHGYAILILLHVEKHEEILTD